MPPTSAPVCLTAELDALPTIPVYYQFEYVS